MAAVEQIVDLKDLPAGTPDPEDVLVYRDVSETDPAQALKKVPVEKSSLVYDEYIRQTTQTVDMLSIIEAKKAPKGRNYVVRFWCDHANNTPYGNDINVDFLLFINAVEYFADTNFYMHVIALDTRSQNMYQNTYVDNHWTGWKRLVTESETINITSNVNQINENEDLNDYVTDGTYVCSGAAKAKTLLNCPYKNGNFKLVVNRNTANYGNQILVSGSSAYSDIFYRGYSSGTYGNWKSFVFDDNDYSRFVPDALAVFLQQANNITNQRGYCNETSINIPNNFAWGMRDVKWLSPNQVAIELIGVTIEGALHKWVNMYNFGSWHGWKEL